MVNKEANINRFENLMSKVTRDGIEDLVAYLKGHTDFFTAPASTRFHLSCEGGLLQHSLNVYDCLVKKKESPIWKSVLNSVSEESIIIMALFHDLCKVNMYSKTARNVKTYDADKVAAAQGRGVKTDELGAFIWEAVIGYEVKDTIPLGHGEKSVIIAQQFIKLNSFEVFAIRWHMGFSVEKADYGSVGSAMELFPIVLALHEADLEATKLMETETGNKEEYIS
jgi:hypothetical protein